ncbi:MAG: response regulator, partial [Nannocystaceae bacterium]
GAINGAEALEMWQAWDPDLILMDIRMPVMDGYEATRTIRRQAPGRRPIILALTASVFDHDRTRMLAVGCDDVVSKPFHAQSLLERLAHHLKLDYLYSDHTARAAHEAQPLQPLVDALRQQPATWCDAVGQATVRADYTRLLALISQIEPTAPQLASVLERWTKNYEYEAICALLDRRDC